MRRTIGFKRFAVLLVSGAMLVLSAAAMSESAVVTKGSKAAEGGECVAETQDMRRNHMEYLKHERVEVVRDGVRDTKYSLAECVNCHGTHDEQGQPVAINSEGQFCDGCHNYTAVSITCFQCHSKVPEEK
jgi:predicted CXXCH cytochrome family protein